jgi:uncharacterized DUF497 family protein
VFEWDARKAATDVRKHGVPFSEAATVFADPDALDGPDLKHSVQEHRFLRLGRSLAGRVLIVAYTIRGGQAMTKRSASSARGGRAGRKGLRTRAPRRIDVSDIPEVSDEQLRAMRRVGHPPLGDAARRLIAIRLDPDVLNRFCKEAKRRKVGYQTLINQVLAEYVEQHVV